MNNALCFWLISGVTDVKADMAANKVTVTGKVDPAKVKSRLEEKTKKKVDLVSPQPKKDEKKADEKKPDEKKPDEKKSDEKSEKKPEEKKAEEKKPAPPKEVNSFIHSFLCFSVTIHVACGPVLS